MPTGGTVELLTVVKVFFFCSFLGFYLFVVIIIIINRRVRMYRYISYFLSLASTARFALPSSGSYNICMFFF